MAREYLKEWKENNELEYEYEEKSKSSYSNPPSHFLIKTLLQDK